MFGLTLDEQDLPELELPYRVEAIAPALVRSLREFQPEGPYLIAGYSLQGIYAYEVAQQLLAQGQEVALLALFDTFVPLAARRRYALGPRLWAHLLAFLRQVGGLRLREAGEHLFAAPGMLRLVLRRTATAQGMLPAPPETLRDALRAAAAAYVPKRYPGAIAFFEAARQPQGPEIGARYGWAELADGGLRLYTVPGDHFTILDDRLVDRLAAQFDRCLQSAYFSSRTCCAR